MESSTQTIRLLICDDHAIFAQALTVALDGEADLNVCATTQTIAEAISSFGSRPHVAIVDARLNDEDGLELVSWITANHPECRTIVLTAFDSDEMLIKASEAGATSFIVKSTSCDYLVSVIRDLVAGYQFLTPEFVAEARSRVETSRSSQLENVSASDRQLIGFVVQGLPDRQIAAEMHLSLQTIRNRVSRLLHTFQLSNRTQLALLFAKETDE